MSDLKTDGYAPGSYSCACTTCGKEFMGDKRAWTCQPCAEWWQDNPPSADDWYFAYRREVEAAYATDRYMERNRPRFAADVAEIANAVLPSKILPLDAFG